MFIKHENALLAVIKSSLLKIYGVSFRNLNLNESSLQTQKSFQSLQTFFGRKSTQNHSASQILSYTIPDENVKPNQSLKKDNKRSRDISHLEHDHDTISIEAESIRISPKSKISRVSVACNNETINSNDQIENHAIISHDKENFFQNTIDRPIDNESEKSLNRSTFALNLQG